MRIAGDPTLDNPRQESNRLAVAPRPGWRRRVFGPAMHHDQRRDAILAAAEQLFRHYGPTKTTMADIAREAGVGVGSVYLEFACKDALIEALSSARHSAVLDAMRSALGDRPGPWSVRFRAMLDARVAALLDAAEAGAHACDLVQCGLGAVQATYARFRSDEARLVADLLREAQAAQEFAPGDPETAAHTVLTAYAAYDPPRVFETPRAEVWARLQATHDLVLFGLLRRPG